jgi:hypothetical protein
VPIIALNFLKPWQIKCLRVVYAYPAGNAEHPPGAIKNPLRHENVIEGA